MDTDPADTVAHADRGPAPRTPRGRDRPRVPPAAAASAWAAAVAGFGLLVLVLLRVGWLVRLDRTVADALQPFTAAHPLYRAALVAWTLAFQPWLFRVLVGALALRLALRRRDRQLGVRLLAALVVGGAVDTGLKAAVGRARPVWAHPVALASGASFPSGHALTSALGCTLLLALARPRLRSRRARGAALAVAVAVPLATGFSRLGLGVHWLSDVVAGWCLGLAVGVAALTVGRGGRGAPHGP